jgi:hypothetical protein
MSDLQTAAGQAENLSQRLDKQAAATAYKKVMAGEQPTSQERAALTRYEREQEEKRRWQYYESIPQKHWRQMSGRQPKVLREQAQRYGLPFGGATIHLPEVVLALHDFLAANARKLAADDDADALLGSDAPSPALERYREERAAIARLDRLERERVLVRRDEIRQGLGRIAAILRTAGETLGQQYGNDAAEILNEALDDAERDIARFFGREADDPAELTDDDTAATGSDPPGGEEAA